MINPGSDILAQGILLDADLRDGNKDGIILAKNMERAIFDAVAASGNAGGSKYIRVKGVVDVLEGQAERYGGGVDLLPSAPSDITKWALYTKSSSDIKARFGSDNPYTTEAYVRNYADKQIVAGHVKVML